jgi:hypothetical protein
VASNFAFYAQGPSSAYTVAAATITFTLSLPLAGGTGTLSVASGIYHVQGMRVANVGTVNVAILTTPADTSAAVLSAANGMPVLANTVETFRALHMPRVQMLCPSGTTTVWITPGEGL